MKPYYWTILGIFFAGAAAQFGVSVVDHPIGWIFTILAGSFLTLGDCKRK